MVDPRWSGGCSPGAQVLSEPSTGLQGLLVGCIVGFGGGGGCGWGPGLRPTSRKQG